MVKIRQQIQHESGIPLGGIGTGSVEVRPDGLFHEWHMFNVGQWNPRAPQPGEGELMSPDDLVFLIRTQTRDGQVLTRYLALREKLHELYSFPYARSVEAIEFEGTFPIATLTYEDAELPVEVRAEIFSPFVPLDSRASGTPGFYVYFTVTNLTAEPVDVSIMAAMRNGAGLGQPDRRPKNVLHDVPHGKAVTLGADGLQEGHCSTGDMTIGVCGGDVSYITGGFERDQGVPRFRGSKYGYMSLGSLHQFHKEGALPDLNAQIPPAIAEEFDAAKLTKTERKQFLRKLTQYPVFYDLYQTVAAVDPAEADSPAFLNNLAKHASALIGDSRNWGWTALCSKSSVAPESETDAMFTIGWYFPNHISPTGENIGHHYEHWFSGSLDVVRFLSENFPELRARTLAMPEVVHSSSLPPEVADAVTGQLSTLTKCTWWTKAGDFGVWEGYGCCGFHTTDITYQGSFPIIALFPDLQMGQMELGARFQREDGRIPHFFRPDFSQVDDQFDRVDMNQQYVMLVARDYLWSGDRGYLERMWPHIVRAMDSTSKLDSDGDGLPDTDTRRNTYDAWDFTGCPSYISSLWLGALKAASRLAREVGDADRAEQWSSQYSHALKSFDSYLWNGKYYVLWRKGDETDEACMSDQLSGDWFSVASGWGGIVSAARARRALQSILKHNFRPGSGLMNATYPPDTRRWMATSCSMQSGAPWTGIEYTVAALLISNGLIEEGLDIVRDIHDRYLRAGRFFNHVECGNHYYRAMSSWSVMLALSGFAWDQPSGTLALAPALEEKTCSYPFFTSGAWGTYYQENSLAGRLVELEIAAGELEIRTLRLPSLSWDGELRVTLGDEAVPCKTSRAAGGVTVTFTAPIVLNPERSLVISA